MQYIPRLLKSDLCEEHTKIGAVIHWWEWTNELNSMNESFRGTGSTDSLKRSKSKQLLILESEKDTSLVNKAN